MATAGEFIARVRVEVGGIEMGGIRVEPVEGRKSTVRGGPLRPKAREPRAPKQNGHVRVLSDGSPEGTRLSVNGFIIQGVQEINFRATPYGVTCIVSLAVTDVDLTAWPEGITVVAEEPGKGEVFHAVPSPMDAPVILTEAADHEPYVSLPWDDPKSDPAADVARMAAEMRMRGYEPTETYATETLAEHLRRIGRSIGDDA